MIHSAFKGIVITFSGHFNAQTTAKRCVNLKIELNMLTRFTFKCFLEPGKLRFAERFCGNDFGRNNSVFIVITRYIFCLAPMRWQVEAILLFFYITKG